MQTAVTINTNVSPGSTTVNSSANSYTFSGSGSIGGSGGLTKSGSSTLTIDTANTYTGGTTINGGDVAINSDASLGASSGLVTINGAALEATASISTSRAFHLSGASAAIEVDPGATYSIGGVISDGSSSGTLNKTGTGTLTVSGANTYTGGTNISSGTISTAENLGAANSSVVIGANGTLSLTAAGTITNTVTGSGAINSTGASIDGNESGFAGSFSHTSSGASTVFDTSMSTSASAAYAMTVNQGSSQGFIADNGGMTLNLGSLSGVADSLFRGSNSGTAGATTLSIGNLGTDTTFAGNITDGQHVTLALTKVGAGTLTLSGANSFSQGTTANGGGLIFASSTAYPANTKLTVNSGALVTFANHGSGANLVPQLSSLTNSGEIDLTNDDMIVHNGSLATLTGEIHQGYNGGSWTGTGITSSAAAATTNTALGVELNSNGSGVLMSAFEGQTVTSTDVLIRYTYYGDANLDGVVNGSDYTLIDNGFNNALTGWHNGDFNYDGVVNGDDYTLIDNAFNTQGASLAAVSTQMIATDTAQVASNIPEPGSFMLALGVGVLMTRRRFKCAARN